VSRFLHRASILAARLSSSPHATILCFHGVEANGPAASGSAHVSTRHFRETIDVARSVARPVPLVELIDRWRAGHSTRGLFAVTFDDAYRSLADQAARDALAGGMVPITIFVVNEATERGLPFWWDRVEALHRVASRDQWLEFERAVGVPDSYRTSAALAYGPLRPMRQWVLERFAGRWPESAAELLSASEARFSVSAPQRAMTFPELESLVACGGVDIGVHTMSHPVLPQLDDDEVRREVGMSYSQLRERWASTLPWLAVPFGLYDDRTARLARDVGVEGILSLNAFSLVHASFSHGLPRVNIMENAPPWKVALRLSGFAERIWNPPRSGIPFPRRAQADDR